MEVAITKELEVISHGPEGDITGSTEPVISKQLQQDRDMEIQNVVVWRGATNVVRSIHGVI
jgi:hypothetical protein